MENMTKEELEKEKDCNLRLIRAEFENDDPDYMLIHDLMNEIESYGFDPFSLF